MSAQYTPGPWSLDDLFPAHDSKEMKKAFKDMEAKVARFEDWRDKLSPDMDVEEFMTAVEQYDGFVTRISRVPGAVKKRVAVPGTGGVFGMYPRRLYVRFAFGLDL